MSWYLRVPMKIAATSSVSLMRFDLISAFLLSPHLECVRVRAYHGDWSCLCVPACGCVLECVCGCARVRLVCESNSAVIKSTVSAVCCSLLCRKVRLAKLYYMYWEI